MTLYEQRDQLLDLSKDLLNYINSKVRNKYQKLYPVAVEDGIALWERVTSIDNKSQYFYTDLTGRILFNNISFTYATPFSNHKAIVLLYDKWYLINLNKQEIIVLPKEINFINFGNFKNDLFSLCKIKKDGNYKWGAYKYQEVNNTFMLEIPFIWDTLQISRCENTVYAGNHLIENNHYRNYFDNELLFTLNILKMSLNAAKNISHYNYELDNEPNLYNPTLYVLQRNIENQLEIQNLIKENYPIADYFFGELFQTELNNFDKPLDFLDNLNEYQKVLGKIKK